MRLVLTLAATCLFVFSIASPAQADAVFSFGFDAIADGTLSAPLVGTGTFSFATDPGDGTFALTSLGAFSMSFTFGGNTYTDADITTPLGEVLVVLATGGPDRTLKFSNTNGFGSGTFGGSLDFVNAVGDLSLSPPSAGLGLYFEENGQFFFGDYLGVQVPEPSMAVLMAVGIAGLALWVRSRRRKAQFQST